MAKPQESSSEHPKKRKSRDRDSQAKPSKRPRTSQLGTQQGEAAVGASTQNASEINEASTVTNGIGGGQSKTKAKKRKKRHTASGPEGISEAPQGEGQDRVAKPKEIDARAERAEAQSEPLTKSSRRKEKRASRGGSQDQKQQKENAVTKKNAASSQGPRDLQLSGQKTKQLQSLNEPSWSLSTPSAGRFIQHDPIFVANSQGEEFIISATDLEVQVLALETSLVVRSHHTAGLGAIRCFTIDYDRDSIVYIGYEDSTVEQWHWETGQVMETSNTKQSGTIQAMCVASTPGNDMKLCGLVISSSHSTVYAGDQIIYRLRYEHDEQLQNLRVFGQTDYVIAHGSTHLVIGRKKANSDVKNLSTNSFVWLEIPLSSKLTCMSARLMQSTHAQKMPGLSLAMGNIEGQILVYDDVSALFDRDQSERFPTPRVLHWHRHAVSSVKFSEDGVYLVSGGKESVLVLWQLNTGKKSFLPHLTSAIERIVVNPRGDRYALQMGDNSIMVLSTSELKPVSNFAGLQLFPAVDASRFEGSMVLHPTDPNRLLLTVPPTDPQTSLGAVDRPFLQTFDIQSSRHLTRQALTRNNVTDFDLGPENTIIHSPDVSQIAVSRDGYWMASIDQWMPPTTDLEYLVANGEGLEEEQRKRREVYLKFWRWDDQQNLWSLVTRADAPHSRSTKSHIGGEEAHGAGKVLALASNPASNEFATLGEDLSVRIWRPKKRTRQGIVLQDDQNRDLVEWICKRTIQLPRDQARDDLSDDAGDEDLIPARACMAYSGDGSLLAVAVAASEAESQMEHILDPSSGEVLRAHVGLADEEIFALGFLERYVIVTTYAATYVWNMITASVERRIGKSGSASKSAANLEYPQLAINEGDKTFAVSTPASKKAKTTVDVYDPANSKKPLFREEFDTPVAAILAGKGARGYKLLVNDATIRSVSPASGASMAAAHEDGASQAIATEAGGFGRTSGAADVEMAELADGGLGDTIEETAEDDRRVVRPEQLADIFDVAQSFAMPPVKDMFQAVVKLFAREPLAAPKQQPRPAVVS